MDRSYCPATEAAELANGAIGAYERAGWGLQALIDTSENMWGMVKADCTNPFDRIHTLEQENKQLHKARQFMDNLRGESGLTARDVDRLCGILHGRTDIESKPLDNCES